MNSVPILVGVFCGCFTAFALLVLCLCCQSRAFHRRFGLRSVDKTIRPVVMLPDLSHRGTRKEYVQPRFEEGSLCVTPHPAVDADEEENSPDNRGKHSIVGVDPDELRGRLHLITSPVPSGLLDFDLSYNKKTKKLCGVVVQARELPMIRDRLPNTFIQVELSPGQGYVHQTRKKNESSNPVYNESFQFGPIDQNELLSQGKIHFRVYHSDYFRREECLAWLDVPMTDFSSDDLAEGELRICRALIQSEAQTMLTLHQTSSTSRSSSETPTRSISKSQSCRQSPLRRRRCWSPQIYLTSDTGKRVMLEAENESGKAASDSEVFTGPKAAHAHAGSTGMLQLSLVYNRQPGRLVVIILKAKDLQFRPNGQPPDVSVRLHVYNDIEQRKHSKKRTVTQKRTTDPVFNESFNVSLPDMAIAHSQLVLSVVDSHGSGHLDSRVIGQLVFGCEVSGKRERKHWLDATSQEGGRLGRQVTMWHSLRL